MEEVALWAVQEGQIFLGKDLDDRCLQVRTFYPPIIQFVGKKSVGLMNDYRLKDSSSQILNQGSHA